MRAAADPTDEGGVPDDRSWAGLPGALAELLLSRRGHAGPRTDHFDGRVFRNPGPGGPRPLLSLLRWRFERRPAPWPAATLVRPGPPPPARLAGPRLLATLAGHSSVLLQTAGLNLLTDPVWSRRAGPFRGLGPRRIQPPGIRFADLPKIDAVLLTHNHYDHLDLPTLRALARRDSPAIVTALGNRAYLERHGVPGAAELDWWQEAALPGGLPVASVPARHFAARGLRDRNRTLWCGFVLRAPDGPIYFAGDTGAGAHFAAIAGRFGPPRLALLPIGAYLPRWFMAPVHLSPEEAVAAHLALGARTSLAIHFGTFPLADDAPGQAEEEFRAAVARAGGRADGFRLPRFGAGEDVP
jgi:L-ascorbate metabolism protein UlaG (beta-lactamase superfamily)